MVQAKNEGYLGNTQIKRVGIETKYTEEELAEYMKCSKDPCHFIENYTYALTEKSAEGYEKNIPVLRMLFNSAVMALGITIGKITISLLSAFAIVYFRFPGRKF